MARRTTLFVGLCLGIWLAEGSLIGTVMPQPAHAGQEGPLATTAPFVLADLSATLVLGALGFSGLALFNRRLRLAGAGRALHVPRNDQR